MLRLYDAIEGDRHFGTGDATILLVLDEGDPALIDGVLRIVHEECADARPSTTSGCSTPGSSIATTSPRCIATSSRARSSTRWRSRRRWSALPDVYDAVLAALRACDDLVVASAHLSHAYSRRRLPLLHLRRLPAERRNVRTSTAACGTRPWTATLHSGAALSHHHGIGLNRARAARAALGAAYDVLLATKAALDPHGILNPGQARPAQPLG